MDVLKILAYNNDRAIREPVVSSIFNYLLSPTADHGLGAAFVADFLSALQGVCSFVDKDLVARVRAYDVDETLEIGVSSEWMPTDRRAYAGRRLDSLLEIRSGRKTCLIGTEIKIYDDSAQDPSQLDDYAAMVAMHRELIMESTGRGAGLPDVKAALIYLVPGNAKKALSFARASTEACAARGVEGVVVLPWWEPNAPLESAGIKPAAATMDGILQGLIEKVLWGRISPCDGNALDLVRSLRSAIAQGFVFAPERGESRFASDSDFEACLSPQARQLLEEFRKAARDEGVKRPLVASPKHTSIGVPFASPPESPDNTLCRIETVESYATATPRTDFVLELSRDRYLARIEDIRRVFSNWPGKVRIDDSPGQFHQNGKDDEEVLRIFFGDLDREFDLDCLQTIDGSFRVFIAMLKRIFKEGRGS